MVTRTSADFRSVLKNKLFWILIVALLLRLPHLAESLWFDEVFSTRVVLDSFQQFLHRLLEAPNPGLYFGFMYGWIALFGDSEISVRIPSLMFGLGSILMTYVLAKRFVNESTALLASLVLAISPVHIWYSQEARHYSIVIFLTLSTIYFFDKSWKSRPFRSSWVPYLFSATCLVATHFYGVFIVGATSLIALVNLKQHSRSKLLLMLNMLVVALFTGLLWLRRDFAITPPAYLKDLTFFEWWMLFFNWFPMGNSVWPIPAYRMEWQVLLHRPALFISQLIFFLIFCNGVAGFLKAKHQRHFLLYVFLTPLCFVLLWLIPQLSSTYYLERTFVHLLPLFTIVLIHGIGRIRFKRKFVMTVFLMFNIVVLGCYFSRDESWTVYKHNPDWRSLAGWIDGQSKNSSLPILVFSFAPPLALSYYTQTPSLHSLGVGDAPANRDYIDAQLSELGVRSFYVISNRYWRPVPKDRLIRNLTADPADFHMDDHAEFKGLDIYQLTRQRGSRPSIDENVTADRRVAGDEDPGRNDSPLRGGAARQQDAAGMNEVGELDPSLRLDR